MTRKKALSVLLVEDDYLIRETIRSNLLEIGCEIVGTASDGMEAVEKTRSLRPDAVIMDLALPKIDGLEASRRIMKHCPTAIIVLTAYESKDLIDEARAAGVGAYMVKPSNRAEIERALAIATARVGDIIRLKKLNQELETRTRELEQSLAEIKSLKGILPICSHCKKIRDDEGYWKQLEAYIRDHTNAEFSHGICPDCLVEHYSEFIDEV